MEYVVQVIKSLQPTPDGEVRAALAENSHIRPVEEVP